MKYISTFIMIILFANVSQAQSQDYNELWKKVEQFENDGLPKSASEIVKQINSQALKDHNKPQQIKTLLYQSKYAMTLEEKAQLKVMADFKNAIATTEAPTKNVLENILATMYWQYFQQNRYQFYNRTNTATKVDETDFQTWDLQTLFDEIHLHYNNSLENDAILKQTKLGDFSAILMEQKNSKSFRPTLYDLLAHNALEFYKTDENSITQPSYKFEIDNPTYLKEAKDFSTLNITAKDSTSLQLHALKLYQKLIVFHLKDKEPYALVDVDIERLNFVADNATFSNPQLLLLETLKASSIQWQSHEVSALYNFEIANIYQEQGQEYDPKINEEHRWKINDALEICKKVLAKYPKSRGAKKCEVLKEQILQPSLQILAENMLPTQQNTLMKVTYQNLEQLQFKIYNISRKQIEKVNSLYRNDEQLAYIKKLDVSTQFQSSLKNEMDYQNHAIEIVIPPLGNGSYLIFASKPESSYNLYAFKIIQVSDIALVNTTGNSTELFQVINRNTGKPLTNASINLFYKRNYNGPTINDTKTTDKYGQFSLIKDDNRLIDLDLEVRYNGEIAFFTDYYVNAYYNNNDPQRATNNAFLFTDRSIYRPGQVVYFKGIAMSTKDDKSNVTPNLDSKVVLYNVNREIIKELNVKTNEFGSVAGEFILPSDGLTGQFTIEFFAGVTAATYFSVEEYKRPKFEAKFEPVTETFKVNDSVTVNGKALAYAGSNITDAKVVYRVNRQVNYPYWYYWSRPWFNSEPQEIAHGESITNDTGEFEVTFKALPDESVDKKGLPVFQYEVTADVTDVNGETRSATTIVNVGYHALLATISIKDKLNKTQKDQKLSIDTQNLNGEFVPATGTIKIYKLKAPNRVLRPRPWEAPDYKTMSEEEFKQRFPHLAYDDESNPESWEKGELVYDKTFDTSKSKELELGTIKKWKSGNYVVILESQDKFGQSVKDEARFMLFDDEDKTLSDNQLFNVMTDKDTYKTGENVIMTFGSSAEDVTVTVDVEKDQKIVNTFLIPLSNNKKTIAIPVTKEDLGGFAIHYSYAVFNAFQSGTVIIAVPYPKTDLEIETSTFRDKLQPGTDETWSFKIKGPKGDKVSAELLASMYDMSLDQFKPHAWSFNPLYQPTYNTYSRREARKSFGSSNFQIYNTLQNNFNYPYQAYDQLNWFGFYFGNNSDYYRGNVYKKNVPTAPMDDSMMLEETEASAENIVVGLAGKVSGLQINSKKTGLNENVIIQLRGNRSLTGDKKALIVIDGIISTEQQLSSLDPALIENVVILKGSEGAALYGSDGSNGVFMITTKKDILNKVAVRKNLQETAFFFPQLQTDTEGNVSFNFTTPEALTKWKLQLLAHTKTLASSTRTLETVTQKELMVIPNAPRFLRQGDQITISTKIANLTDKQLSGQARLELTDAVTGHSIDGKLNNADNLKPFTVDAKGNTQTSWSLTIPDDVDAVQYKIVAKAGDFSDGEQSALPVLTNRMLVTETLPMWVRSNETRTFTLDKLKTNTSTTLKNHKLTLEITSNPAWYAVQALPYLMEYPYDCNEQTFSRYYANALASYIANSNPRIQEVFNQWASQDALISNLEKNEELKNILIQETPWLRDAQSETEQKKRIALLFDMNKMNNELQFCKA